MAFIVQATVEGAVRTEPYESASRAVERALQLQRDGSQDIYIVAEGRSYSLSAFQQQFPTTEKVEVIHNATTNQFSIALTQGTDVIRCMVSVAVGHGDDTRSDDEKQRAALSRAKALAKALDAAIEDQ